MSNNNGRQRCCCTMSSSSNRGSLKRFGELTLWAELRFRWLRADGVQDTRNLFLLREVQKENTPIPPGMIIWNIYILVPTIADGEDGSAWIKFILHRIFGCESWLFLGRLFRQLHVLYYKYYWNWASSAVIPHMPWQLLMQPGKVKVFCRLGLLRPAVMWVGSGSVIDL